MADAITIKALQDASLDAKSLEEVVNGDEVKQVTTRKGETYPSVKKAIKTLFENGGLPATPFATKALMTASALVDGDYAQVTDNTVDNGLYVKTAGAWVKSAYDPLTQAAAVATLKDNAVLDKVGEVIYTNDSSDDIIDEVDVNGVSVRKVTKEGRHYFVGLEQDLKSELNRYATTDESSDYILESRDVNGVITLAQDKRGHLLIPEVGDLTQAVLDVVNRDTAPTGINLEAAHLAGKYADYTLAENMASYSNTGYLLTAAEINALAIFDYTVGKVRIPALNRIGKNKYLLFFEVRENGDDLGLNSQGVATIDIDPVTFEVTKSNIQSLHTAFTDSEGKLRTFMNGCGVKLDSGEIICMYVRRHGLQDHQLYTRTSLDDGATWSAFTDITSIKGDTNWNLIAPCSKGLIKRYGQHKGRIVFPTWTSGEFYGVNDFRSGYIYSDDNALTWKLGEFADYPTANEVQCAEDLNGDMLFSIRMEDKQPPKILARLSDKTKKYTTVPTNKPLTGEAIMSGLIQGENEYDFTAAKFQLVTCSLRYRSELLIHTSYDGGSTWRSHLLPSTVGKTVSYSCIENISATHKFVLWEADSVDNFKYAIVSLNNLIEEQ